MTFVEYVLIGYFVGVLITAPVGPVNVMAIQHAVHGGFRQGVFVGLGAVLADTIFASAAIFGISAITNFIEGQINLIEIVGGALLIVFGIKIWNTHPHLDRDGNGWHRGFLGDATAAFFMAITNPGAVIAFVAIFGGLGEFRPAPGDHIGALLMVAGVASGATSWWVVVSAAVSHYRARIDDRWLDRANHIAGFVLVAFGALIYLKLALSLTLLK
ncbi:LysE family transporter [Labrenzia sp. 011]|uniref:LysE family translocator n=1 Tax=Labrenzia sp. 011 TaxID=2171494 RepID=UPI000D513CFE|nr:LysE family transporter [Labrenzia sp. 011]PVB63004.1 lysine transporter LysE [Labrenzia sp. 011]